MFQSEHTTQTEEEAAHDGSWYTASIKPIRKGTIRGTGKRKKKKKKTKKKKKRFRI